jgi:hypothetical protein
LTPTDDSASTPDTSTASDDTDTQPDIATGEDEDLQPTSITSEETPLAAEGLGEDISLLNMILALLALLAALLLVIYNLINRRSRHLPVVVSAVVAIALGLLTTVVWLLLDGLRLPNTWLDAYTPIIVALAALAALALVLHLVLRSRTQDEDADVVSTP